MLAQGFTALILCLLKRTVKVEINFPEGKRRRNEGRIQRRLESRVRAERAEKAGSSPILPEARALQANHPCSSGKEGGRQVLKGQLNYLISVQGMLCSKSYVWELDLQRVVPI